MLKKLRKIISLLLVAALAALAFTPATVGAVASNHVMAVTTTNDNAVDDGDALVRTWENTEGEKITCFVTRGANVLAARTNPEENAAAGFITEAPTDPLVSSYALDEYQVSDYFYMQIRDNNDQIVSIYKLTITGVVSRVNSSRYINSMEFTHHAGDECTTYYEIDGYTAFATIIHPVEGHLSFYLELGTGGSFRVY